MAAFDFEAFATEVVEAVSQSVKPLRDRISELEKQLAERLTVAGAHIDRCDGSLVLTYTNGTEKNLGTVTTKGEPGTDGKDGFDLSNFDIQLGDDGRTLDLIFEDETRKASASFTLPTMIYRGVWTQDHAYQKGDTVTYQGSLFVALSDTVVFTSHNSSSGLSGLPFVQIGRT